METIEYVPTPNCEGFIFVIGAGLPRTGTSSLRIPLSLTKNLHLSNTFWLYQHWIS